MRKTKKKGGSGRVPLFHRKEKRSKSNKRFMKYAKRQNAQTNSPVIPTPLSGEKRVSRRALPGNMTVEAAIVLPIFLYAMLNLLSLLLAFQEYSIREGNQHQAGRWMALAAYGQEEGKPDIELVEVGRIKSLFPVAAFPAATVVNGCVMHKWIGYDLSGEGGGREEQREELVYVTPSGSAYHRRRSCVYLNPSIRMAAREQAQAEGYTACGTCRGDSRLVYVTDGGSRYHSTVECGGIKRTIESVPLSKALASGRHACPECG